MRVLVIALSFGSGHTRAAAAVAAELRRGQPDTDVRVIDALDGARWWFRAAYVWPYWLMVRYAPALWRWLFQARLRSRSRQTAPEWMFRFGCPRVFAAVQSFRPDVIVAAEVAAGEIAGQARRLGLTAAPIVSVITDHHAEPAWVRRDVAAYAVADEAVASQLVEWGAERSRVLVTGIPTDAAFAQPFDRGATGEKYGLPRGDERPLVLLMGGGMGPTRMDLIADGLCRSGRPMHIVAVAGRDAAAAARLSRVASRGETTIAVRGWVDDVPALMQAAAILVTKPGGLTAAEAAISGVPAVLFDVIPGPEEHNADRIVGAGAAVRTSGTDETVAAVLSLVDDEVRRGGMARRARQLAAPHAAAAIADMTRRARVQPPVLLLTISNGSGHTRVAEAIVEELAPGQPARIVDVADYMSLSARFTHVSLYLWLVRHMPTLWGVIDRYQKRQPHTSPEWFYRNGCRRLFSLIETLQPAALIATEVGCLEIAALIKRDLGLACPLVAVNGEYDAERAWVQREVDAYSVPTPEAAEELHQHGAERMRIHVWGVPLARALTTRIDRAAARAAIDRDFAMAASRPLLIVGGGSEGLGRPEDILRRLMRLEAAPQVIVLAGRNRAVRRRCEAVAAGAPSVRVLGWTDRVAELFAAADLLISKPGHTFDEAIAAGLPLISLPPPPGSEELQVALLDRWNVGRAVADLDDLERVVARLLASPEERESMRTAALGRRNLAAAAQIATWVDDAIESGSPGLARPAGLRASGRLALTTEGGR